eukprot:TRINITY_DN4622_c0_g1_i2.p1 TRINITY_DN4622_c0_g1~~TRINITY_DN4622_c0_g1_i2.p1  ORF type:complete len:454 (+),score=108.99 TRINITY_DN4622_c0_g1_i2:382-1743(+)
MLIAVEGCCHGELDIIYRTLQAAERQQGVKVDLLLICGDFQAVRDDDDLRGLACPQKYRVMGDFESYHSGAKVAPVLTIFIGGNHEASNHSWETYYGGWAAENIYFLGFGGVVNFNGLVIAGTSGIYKSNDYYKGYTERPPYTDGTMRSIYHTRDFEIQKMLAWGMRPDVFLTHDWPRGIYDYGDAVNLVRWKKQFKDEIDAGVLGSPPAETLLKTLRPQYHFSGHLHCKFSAVVDWAKEDPKGTGTTKFLALDKCLPKRGFLQILNIPALEGMGVQDNTLYRDTRWLAVLKAANELMPVGKDECRLRPEEIAEMKRNVNKHHEWVVKKLGACSQGLPVTPWDPAWASPNRPNYTATDNPQTAQLCEFLEIDNKIRSQGGAPLVSRHLVNSSAAATHQQLGRIASGITDANKMLDALLDSAPTTAHTAPQAQQAAEPAPAEDDDVFPLFVDTN